MSFKKKCAGCVLLFAFSTLALWGIDFKNYNDGQAVAVQEDERRAAPKRLRLSVRAYV